jgi:hypothetical protein
MDNSKSFENITDAITKTNATLATYNLLVNRAEIAQTTVSALEAEVANLRNNSGNLDPKTRGAKFTATNSALSLAQSDLQSVQEALVAQKALTAATGKAAASRLFEVRDLLRMQRLKNVSAQLAADFDLTSLPVRLQEVAGTHKSVRALKDLGVSQLWFQLQHDDGFVIGAVRHLDEHWAELRAIAEAENLELAIAAVQVPTVAKPKPAAVGNALGVLAEPVMA